MSRTVLLLPVSFRFGVNVAIEWRKVCKPIFVSSFSQFVDSSYQRFPHNRFTCMLKECFRFGVFKAPYLFPIHKCNFLNRPYRFVMRT